MRTPALALLLAVGLAACDATSTGLDAAPASAVTLDARDAVAGDILYTIEPLAVGESFVATFDAGPASSAIRSARQSDGYVVTFEPTAAVDRVVVTYLFNGEVVTEPIELNGHGGFVAGATANEPDSYHWGKVNGKWVVMQDYMYDPGTSSPTDPDEPVLSTGALFTTPTGEQVRVTHVQFELVGLGEVTPEAVRFESPRAIEIRSQELRRGSLAVR